MHGSFKPRDEYECFSYFSVTTQNTVVIETQWTEGCNYRYKWGGKYSVGTWWAQQIYPGALWLLPSTSRCLMDLGNSSRGRLTRWHWPEVCTCHWTQSSFPPSVILSVLPMRRFSLSLLPSPLHPSLTGSQVPQTDFTLRTTWSFYPAISISWELRVQAF